MLNLAFQYHIENLRASVLDISSFNTDTLWILGVLVGSFIALTLIYKLGLYIYGYTLLRRETREKESKKTTIQDLILMKTIQGELEREMEEALLNSALIRQS